MAQWTIREQLILGSAVQRSGDQNWVSVSRTIRPLSEENRQADFYSQKNCAMHYAALLDSASTPKRKKKRGSESETGETTQDLIVRELTEKRLAEINQLLDSISSEYHEVKKDLELIEKGQLSDVEITNMWNRVKDVDYNEIVISRSVNDDTRDEQKNDQLTADKSEPETVSSSSDRPIVSLSDKPPTSDTSKTSNLATPLIATPIITPVGNSATLIKIEPNVAMETIGGAKPVQVKVLSHDDHTYSSPGPPTLLTTAVNAAEMKEDQTHAVDDNRDQTLLTVDQMNDETTSNNNMVTATSDQAVSSDDQNGPPTDHITPNIDQTLDQTTADVDQITPSVNETTANVDQVTSGIDQTTPSKVTTTEQGAIKLDEDKVSVDNVTPNVVDHAIDQPAVSSDHVTDQSISTMDQASDVKVTKDVNAVTDQVAVPMDDQTDSSADQARSVDDHATHTADQASPNVDHSVATKAECTDKVTNQVSTDPVNDNATPTTTNPAILNVNQTTPTADHPTPAADQGTTSDQRISGSDQNVVTIEKKSRTRGSNRIASKMKMVQVGKAKRATSPRTMVIIGKQQSAVESDNEEIQVHYKEPTRRLHRLMSNEPSESEEEPLSAVTSGVTSPSSSMMDEIDPEIAQSMKLWRKSIMLVWQHASQHKFASLFLHAVKDDEAAGYSEVVFRPMDLSLIKKKIETGVIRNDMEFQRDMLLMFQNALMYNSSNHDV